MKPNGPAGPTLVLVLLGFGSFYLIAAVLSLLFWLIVGAWQPYVIAIAGISAGLTLLGTGLYQLWKQRGKN
ncbi:MAG TPA: hypothetical protein VF177_23535 [Anaerolineae bacterium]